MKTTDEKRAQKRKQIEILKARLSNLQREIIEVNYVPDFGVQGRNKLRWSDCCRGGKPFYDESTQK
jgi:hypothetical protein